MNISLASFAAFLGLLCVLAWRWPRLLFIAWPMALLVFPSTRTNIGSAPIYWYDAICVLILCRLYFSHDLRQWPDHVPRWHWWFVATGAVFGTLLPIARYGGSLEMGWILGHASLAWMAFAIGLSLFIGPNADRYRTSITWGLFLSLALDAALAILQFGNEAMAEAINHFFFRDMQGHLVLLEEVGARISSSRVNGPHGDPNTFGGTTAIVCAICLLLFREKSQRFGLISIALAGIVVGATVSRQVLVAAVIGFLVAFMLGTAGSRVRILAAMSALLVVGLASGVAASWAERLGRWEGGVSQDTNVVGRIIIGPMRLIRVINADPTVLFTGVGLDVQKLVKKADGKAADVGIYQMGFASNSFLLPLYYLGMVGFVLTFAFWIWTLRRALAQPRNTRALDVGCVVAAMVLIASDNYAFVMEVTVAMLFLLAAVVCGRQLIEAPPPETIRPKYENLVP